MLATVPHDIPLREHSHLDLQHPTHSDNVALEDRLCPGCKNSVVNEQGGLVVAFGQSFFHVDCFKCAKCRNQVTADTNLLLLSDGSPICANCSYSCNICHLPILDEAIMTGDDSYHAHCFKCKVCSNRIDELVFAKTSQGIYCMNCHNERMIKIRKHAQKKAERERANGGSGSSRSREQEARNFHRDQDRSTVEEQSHPGAIRSPPALSSSRSEGARIPAIRSPTRPHFNEGAPPPSYSHSTTVKPRAPLSSFSNPFPSQSPSVTVAPPSEPDQGVGQNYSPLKSNTLPIPPLTLPLDVKRRSSYDDGAARPLNVQPRQDSLLPDNASLHPHTLLNGSSPSEGLSVTSRRDKRRSINPSVPLSPFKDISSTQSSELSSRHGSLSAQGQNSTPIPAYLTAHGQSQQFAFSSQSPSRPSSRSSSIQSTPSSHEHFDLERHRPLSPPNDTNPYDGLDDTIVMSPPTMVVELEIPIEPSHPTPLETNGKRFSDSGASGAERSSATLSPTDLNGFRSKRRGSSASNRSADSNFSANASRSASPAYRADVPHGVESGTDTEPENETDISSYDNHEALPPAPPPKDANDSIDGTNMKLAYGEADRGSSEGLQLGDMSDDMGESLAVERMSHTTFIAPALPPIRFSMNGADFSELLSSVGGSPSLKSLDSLAKRTKQPKENTQSTPPPTATSFLPDQHSQTEDITPTSGIANEINQRKPASNAAASVDDSHDSEQGFTSETRLSVPSQSPDTVDAAYPTPTISALPRRAASESDVVVLRLRETLNGAKEKGARYLKVDIGFVDAIVDLLESRNAEYNELKTKVDGMNRESKLYIDGLTVAQVEYDRELKARRDAEAEVTRLRVLLSGQAVRLTALSGDTRRQELRQQLSKELNDSLSGLEHDLSRLKVERDVTLAEVEELSAKRSTGSPNDVVPTNLGRSLTKRLESIRHQYQRELEPLTQQKEVLTREVAELKAVRDVFLEETAVLNARNEELAQLSAVYARRIDNAPAPELPSKSVQDLPQITSDAPRPQPQSQSNLLAPSLSASTSGSSTVYDESPEYRPMKAHKSENELHTPMKPKFKWPGSRPKELASPSSNLEISRGKAHIEHNFQQLSILRFTRCDHCGDKMWGSQLRCTVCSTSIHVRCIANVQIPCAQHQNVNRDEPVPLPPSMFGRDLTEQVLADSKGEERQVPVIVEKCIEAVEERALDYEGVYRKTGGSGQSKAITQMFERGDYMSFDLCDSDRFNDICSVTSVLKTYFRSLPVPLLTFDLHDQFTTAIAIRDLSLKQQTLTDLVHKLPDEHYFTLRMLMLHLNHIHERCEKNLMNARNLGVVFGPTLMRSRDPGAEFSDMAGKALFIEWLVDNAPEVFNTPE
ncbi:hypothetical protein GALMADRAFT_248760 [Galerina marginata CBS 339.88]|uniref:RhoGAP-domain-containing protein n=1 Tax=Galerina marginata (strain CBS 339.88) TaxID=685588 RepID=A0A067T0Z0_GALM3|nr:hypothetical protein GALMADRAFT_248760 [Galerina marginata CBS 339.88]